MSDENEKADTPTDPREQMRLALERKRPHDSAGTPGAKGGAKASSAHESHKVSREFRRKSGG